MPFPIHDREHRRNLEPRTKPYFARLCDGIHVGYRKGKVVSRWVVRRYDGRAYRMETLSGIYPDDEFPADGTRVLNFQDVVAKIMSENTKIPVRCSFCGKNNKEVAMLIAGPSVFICDECVALCQMYIDRPNVKGHKLVVGSDGKAVLKDGEPVFELLTPEAEKTFREHYEFF